MKSNPLEGSLPSVANPQPSLAHVCLASCRKVIAQIDRVKAGLLSEWSQKLEAHEHVLELALNEAEALAWQSGFPQLFFPVLAAEKAEAVTTWHARQEGLRRHGLPRVGAA